jgi:hypothetical protein
MSYCCNIYRFHLAQPTERSFSCSRMHFSKYFLEGLSLSLVFLSVTISFLVLRHLNICCKVLHFYFVNFFLIKLIKECLEKIKQFRKIKNIFNNFEYYKNSKFYEFLHLHWFLKQLTILSGVF